MVEEQVGQEGNNKQIRPRYELTVKKLLDFWYRKYGQFPKGSVQMLFIDQFKLLRSDAGRWKN